MKKNYHYIFFGILLIVCSVFFYVLHYLIFRDLHHIFLYLVGDIAFVFIEVLLVTLIIQRVLNEREKQTRLEKLNMVIGVFFSEVGTELLTIFSNADHGIDTIRSYLVDREHWKAGTFDSISKPVKNYEGSIAIERINLASLKLLLHDRRDFLLRLLENPNLLEHETFTDLLRSVFHLTEELEHRESFDVLPPSDFKHLAGDSTRAYRYLIIEWLSYMKQLRDNYPYLFSLAVRMNPFDREASAVVKDV